MAQTRTEEQALIERCLAGDERAFGDLVAPHRRLVFSAAYRICGNQSDAEDAVQSALLSAWKKLDTFQGNSKFSSWLYRITTNAALGMVRKRVPEPASDLYVEPAAGGSEPGDQVATGVAVQDALDALPPMYRSVLIQRDLLGLTYKEVAANEGISVDTATTRIARARKAAAALLEGSL